MQSFIGIPSELLFSVIGIFGTYIFFDFRRQIKEELSEINAKIEKVTKELERLKNGEFIEKIVKNTIYSPDSRDYFKTIFRDVLSHVMSHHKNNETNRLLHLIEQLEEIKGKIK